MITIKQLLNKILWDVNENKNDYVLLVYDRMEKKFVRIKFEQIQELENNFLKVKNDKNFVYIPLHRIKIVLKNNEVFWKRKSF